MASTSDVEETEFEHVSDIRMPAALQAKFSDDGVIKSGIGMQFGCWKLCMPIKETFHLVPTLSRAGDKVIITLERTSHRSGSRETTSEVAMVSSISGKLATIQLDNGTYTKTKMMVTLPLEAITLIPSFLQENDDRKLPVVQD